MELAGAVKRSEPDPSLERQRSVQVWKKRRRRPGGEWRRRDWHSHRVPQGGEGGWLGRKPSFVAGSGARDFGDVAARDPEIVEFAIGKSGQFVTGPVEIAALPDPQSHLFHVCAQMLNEVRFKSADIVDKGHVRRSHFAAIISLPCGPP